MKQCHRCRFNGLSCDACLSCDGAETYRYYRPSVDETYEDNEQPSTAGSEQATSLAEDVEDRFRKSLYDLFDLSQTELLCLKAIMNGKALNEFALDMEQLAPSISAFSRFRAFQTRKSILRKMPGMKDALITSGQRKKLK